MPPDEENSVRRSDCCRTPQPVRVSAAANGSDKSRIPPHIFDVRFLSYRPPLPALLWLMYIRYPVPLLRPSEFYQSRRRLIII